MFTVKREVILSKIQLSLRGQRTKRGEFDWTSAVLDAAIISGITLCTGFGTLASSCVLTANSGCILLSAVGAEFLGILATKRGLTPVSCER
jgi:hypothetical protein